MALDPIDLEKLRAFRAGQEIHTRTLNEIRLEGSEFVKRVRWGMRLTQRQLARRMGVTQAAVCRIERGVDPPSIPILQALLRACEEHMTQEWGGGAA